MGANRQTRVVLAIEIDSEPIRGSICELGRPEHAFRGWLELAQALEAARAGASGDGSRWGAENLGGLPGVNPPSPL
jgi:hypothetical protein